MQHHDEDHRIPQDLACADWPDRHLRPVRPGGIDWLTGLADRTSFRERLHMEVERHQRSGSVFALLLVDVDGFATYVDELGTSVGDETLRKIAWTLADGRRVNDVVARCRDDEFAVILAGSGGQDAVAVGERLRRRVAIEPFVEESLGSGGPTISIGVATCPDDAASAEELIAAAARALSMAKRDGGNRVGVCWRNGGARTTGPRSQRKPDARGGKRCVLVAEDDDELRELLTRRLSIDGYRVLEARDGTELLEHLASMQLHGRQRSKRVDLVLSDIRMPGWTGLQILEGLRETGWAPPVILMTAFPDADAHRSARRLGAAATFEKPFDMDDLSTAILNLLPDTASARPVHAAAIFDP